MTEFRTIEFMANSPLEDEAETVHITMGDMRAVVRMREAMGDLLFSVINARYGNDTALSMRLTDWSSWPESVAFKEARIENARKAYRGEM